MFFLLLVGFLFSLTASSEITNENQNEDMTQVQAVINTVALLPCNLAAPAENDFVTLVIWYRVESDSPLYSVDARERPLEQASHWSKKSYSGRVFFQLSDNSSDGKSRLSLRNINQTDGGNYKCRVDFKKSPTRNSFVNLTVIVPPKKLIIMNEKSEVISRPTIGPYSEGQTISITCIAAGGHPSPSVTWWLGGELVDSTHEIESGDQVKNEIVIKDLSRQHSGLVYTCQGVNSQILPPLSADVRIDMYLKILDVHLVGDNLSLSAGSEYEVACQAIGSRPQAVISWWKAGQLLDKVREKTSPDGNVTISTLAFTPTTEDLGKSLSCRATNPHVMGSAREDTWTLNVHYSPQVTLTLGSNINGSSIREGVDVYFECSVKANPRIRLVSWQHEGKNLSNNATAGTIIANQTLVLQSISRQNTGLYTCSASNSEGSAESNSFMLDVKYEPQCRDGQQRIYGAARNEVISVSCEVDSNPSAKLFRWVFNNSIVKSKEVIFRTFEQGGKSVATYAPSSEQGYGTLLCWGRNELGPQLVPCVFHIVPAGKPDPPKNCNLKNKTQTSLHVSCAKGFDGGLPQEFTLEVFDASSASSKPGRLIVNITRRTTPEFSVGSLEPGGSYFLNIYSSNNKGKSNSVVSVKVTTLQQTQQEHRRNIPGPLPTTSLLSNINPLIWLSVGVVCIIAITTSVLIVMKVKGVTIFCCCESEDDDTQNSINRSELNNDSSKLPKNAATSKAISKNFIGENYSDVDDRNPDVVPLTNDLPEQTNLTDSAEGDSSRNWKSDSDIQFPLQVKQFSQSFQLPVMKGNLAYEIPAPLDKWTHQILWPGEQHGSGVPQSQYNIVVNKQNMVLVDSSLNQNPLLLTTLAVDPVVLTPSNEQSQTSPDVSINPCILLNRNPDALLTTIPKNLQIVSGNDRTRLYNTMPSKMRQQNAETQTPRLIRHKESAV